MSDSTDSPNGSSHATRTVLVVEDEFLIRLTLSEVLVDEGYRVLEAENAAAAIQLLDANPAIDVLLTDVQMPGGMDGHGLVQRARAARPDLPVIFMTGAPENTAGMSLQRTLYLAKPYSPGDMCAAVKHLLNGAG